MDMGVMVCLLVVPPQSTKRTEGGEDSIETETQANEQEEELRQQDLYRVNVMCIRENARYISGCVVYL